MSSLQVTFRSIPDSPAIEYHIEKYYAKVCNAYRKVSSCRVVLDAEQKHRHKGKVFSVRIDITIPGRELVSRKQNQNLYVAMRDAFDAIEKLLEKSCKRKPASRSKHAVLHVCNDLCGPDTAVTRQG